MRVGRATSNELFVMDPVMSREHFEIDHRDDHCIFRDLNSRNGSQLNGVSVRAEKIVRKDATIVAGCTRFRLTFHGATDDAGQDSGDDASQPEQERAQARTWKPFDS